MAFNPSAGYDLISSKGEVGDFLGSLSGANSRGQSAMASAALRAKNYIDTAEKRAQLEGMGMPQQASRSNPMEDALLGIAGNVGSGLVKGFGNYLGERSYLNDRYGSPSGTPYGGPLPSTTTDWAAPPPLTGP